jgi:hypothetical protein
VRYDHKCILVLVYSTRYSCPILMKVEFSGQIFEKYSNVIFHENLSSGSQVVQCGQTDRHMTELIAAFHNCVKTPRKEILG